MIPLWIDTDFACANAEEITALSETSFRMVCRPDKAYNIAGNDYAITDYYYAFRVHNENPIPVEAVFEIMYGQGISKWGELVDLAVQMDIVQKSGSWFSMGDERIGQGASSVKEYLIANPHIAEKVEAQVRENLWRLNGGAPKAPAKVAERAVAVSADDFDDED